MQSEIKFLAAVWKTNILSVMEYRVSFLSQMLGMILNDAIYFVIWVIFFDRFNNVNGWGLPDMFVTFGVTASSFGLVSILFGNSFYLGEIIKNGRLDYYLSLPRPVLLHAISSRTIGSGFGDLTYGFISFAISGIFSFGGLFRFILAIILAAVVFTSFLIIFQSTAFWFGDSVNLAATAINALVTFAIYPITLFDNFAKIILFTVIPAALVGAVPAAFTRGFSWQLLVELFAGAIILLFFSLYIFSRGLRHYESGSGIQIEI